MSFKQTPPSKPVPKPITALRQEIAKSVTPNAQVFVGRVTGIRLGDGTEFAVMAADNTTLERVFGKVADLGDVFRSDRVCKCGVLALENIQLDDEI